VPGCGGVAPSSSRHRLELGLTSVPLVPAATAGRRYRERPVPDLRARRGTARDLVEDRREPATCPVVAFSARSAAAPTSVPDMPCPSP